MKITLPDIQSQQRFVLQASIEEAIGQLKKIKNVRSVSPIDLDGFKESDYPNTHLLREREGYEPPAPEVVRAYLAHFQMHCPEFDTDEKIAVLMNVTSRRIRAYKKGEEKVPFGIWRRFLVATGRAAQDILPVYFVIE